MLSISINVAWLPGIAIVCAFAGFAFRSYQIKKSKKRILVLENEMLTNHAEILRLQQELATLKNEYLTPYKSRVVTMNELPPEETPESKDAIQRKKNAK